MHIRLPPEHQKYMRKKHVNRCGVGHEDSFGQRYELSKPPGFCECPYSPTGSCCPPTNESDGDDVDYDALVKLINCKIVMKAINPQKLKECFSQLIRRRSHADENSSKKKERWKQPRSNLAMEQVRHM